MKEHTLKMKCGSLIPNALQHSHPQRTLTTTPFHSLTHLHIHTFGSYVSLSLGNFHCFNRGTHIGKKTCVYLGDYLTEITESALYLF